MEPIPQGPSYYIESLGLTHQAALKRAQEKASLLPDSRLDAPEVSRLGPFYKHKGRIVRNEGSIDDEPNVSLSWLNMWEDAYLQQEEGRSSWRQTVGKRLFFVMIPTSLLLIWLSIPALFAMWLSAALVYTKQRLESPSIKKLDDEK